MSTCVGGDAYVFTGKKMIVVQVPTQTHTTPNRTAPHRSNSSRNMANPPSAANTRSPGRGPPVTKALLKLTQWCDGDTELRKVVNAHYATHRRLAALLQRGLLCESGFYRMHYSAKVLESAGVSVYTPSLPPPPPLSPGWVWAQSLPIVPS